MLEIMEIKELYFSYQEINQIEKLQDKLAKKKLNNMLKQMV